MDDDQSHHHHHHHPQQTYYYQEPDDATTSLDPYGQPGSGVIYQSQSQPSQQPGPSCDNPISPYVDVEAMQNVHNTTNTTLPRSLSASDISAMHISAQHPHAPHAHPHSQQQPVALNIDLAHYQHHQQHQQQQQQHPHHQQLYHPQGGHPLVHQHPPHQQSQGPLPVSVSVPIPIPGATSGGIPVVPSHPHQAASHTSPSSATSDPPPSPIAYDSLQSPAHSQNSSLSSDHSLHHHHQQLHQHHHTHSGPHHSYFHQATTAGGPGHITPNTTPSSGAASPTGSHSRSSSLVHRSQTQGSANRYHPNASPSPTLARGRGSRLSTSSQEGEYHNTYASDGEGDDDHDHDLTSPTTPGGSMGAPQLQMGLNMNLIGNGAHHHMGLPISPTSLDPLSHNRKEATRRQRIEAEQRRRDELREGYARLKDVLPITNQKSSKVSLLERAVMHILNLTKMNETLQARLTAQESEISRLRMINESIALPGLSPGLSPKPRSDINSPTPMDGQSVGSLEGHEGLANVPGPGAGPVKEENRDVDVHISMLGSGGVPLQGGEIE